MLALKTTECTSRTVLRQHSLPISQPLEPWHPFGSIEFHNRNLTGHSQESSPITRMLLIDSVERLSQRLNIGAIGDSPTTEGYRVIATPPDRSKVTQLSLLGIVNPLNSLQVSRGLEM